MYRNPLTPFPRIYFPTHNANFEKAQLIKRLKTTRSQLEDTLRLYRAALRQARTDALTGLPNRRALEENLNITPLSIIGIKRHVQ